MNIRGCLGTHSKLVRRFLSEDSGASLIEYALVACLVGLAAVAGLSNISAAVQNAVWVGINKVYNAYASQ